MPDIAILRMQEVGTTTYKNEFKQKWIKQASASTPLYYIEVVEAYEISKSFITICKKNRDVLKDATEQKY